MNVLFVHRFEVVFFAGGAQIAFFEEVAVHFMVDEDPDSDVELPPVNKQWLFDVLLDRVAEALY